jgi:carbonic anhydrase
MEQLLGNNLSFAGTDARSRTPDIPFIPNRQLFVLTCVDPRVDPSDILGLTLGDAIVARNVGGRANRAFLDDLAWITHLHRTLTPDADWFEVVVIHHTDCGSGLMADDRLRGAFVEQGYDDATLRATAVTEPEQTVRADVATILSSTALRSPSLASGYTYDVATGLLTQAVAPRAADGYRVPGSVEALN